MHFYRCTDYADHSIYPGPDSFFADLSTIFQQEIAELATAGCKYIQLDEVAVALLCDPGIREQVKNLGAPDTLVTLYITSINDAVSKCPPDVVIGGRRAAAISRGIISARAVTRRSQNNSLPKRKSTTSCLNTTRHGPAISLAPFRAERTGNSTWSDQLQNASAGKRGPAEAADRGSKPKRGS